MIDNNKKFSQNIASLTLEKNDIEKKVSDLTTEKNELTVIVIDLKEQVKAKMKAHS